MELEENLDYKKEMMKLIKISILLVIALLTRSVYSQDNNTVKQVQYKIIVVPHVKEGQDIRTILEDDFNKRIALSKVKEAFDKRGFITYDFTQSLKIALQSMTTNTEMKNDLKTQAIELSGADIWINTEVFVQKSSSGNSVKIILEARDAYTGQSLANKTGDSGKFYTDDIAKLSQKAVDSCIEQFLDMMNTKFADIVKNGRSIRLDILIDENSELTMDSEIGTDGDLISDLIEDWLDDNSYKNYYHIMVSSESKIIIDDFRIPLRDEKGRNYKASKVLRKLRKFAKNSLGLTVKQGIKTEAKIELILQ